jgi:hypothetical protein
MKHKMAAFHYMLHRACNLLLSRENFEKKQWHTSRRRQGSMDILKPPLTGSCQNIFSNIRSMKSPHCPPISKKVTSKRAGLTFHLSLSRKISNIMAKHDIQMVPKASRKLAQVLGSPKRCSGRKGKVWWIYAIQCQTDPTVYFEQTRRRIDERFKEHISMVRTRAEEKSSVAKHLLKNPGHVITLENLSLVKRVHRLQHLDTWEFIIIRKND